MKIFRPSRFLAALVTLFCLLFSQLAVASYVCPSGKMGQAPLVSGAGNTEMIGAVAMDPQQPGLCKAHCQPAEQTLDIPAAPHVQPFIAAELAIVLVQSLRHRPVASSADLEQLTRTTAPPIAIRNCCFRI